MKCMLMAVLALAFAAFSFAGACPAGASDCFLCGGVNGIPCARSDSCPGYHDANSGLDIACACPQGKPCVCYCPYADYGAQRIGPQPPADRCPAGCTDCTADKAVCISHGMEDIAPQEGGDAGMITAMEGEVLVSSDGGRTWARGAAGGRIGDGYIVKTAGAGKAVVLTRNGWVTELGPDTQITLHQQKQEDVDTTIIEDLAGMIFGYTEKEFNPLTGGYEVVTPLGTATAVRTQFSVSYDPVKMEGAAKLYRGGINVTTRTGTIQLEKNEMVRFTESGAGQVTGFDPSEDKTPWSGGGCGSAFIVALPLTAMLLRKR